MRTRVKRNNSGLTIGSETVGGEVAVQERSELLMRYRWCGKTTEGRDIQIKQLETVGIVGRVCDDSRCNDEGGPAGMDCGGNTQLRGSELLMG
jgi:hypothetical protein